MDGRVNITEKQSKSKKAVKISNAILAVVIVLIAGFTVFSHAVRLRFDMATLVELYFRVSGTKTKFSDAEECAEYIAIRGSRREGGSHHWYVQW